MEPSSGREYALGKPQARLSAWTKSTKRLLASFVLAWTALQCGASEPPPTSPGSFGLASSDLPARGVVVSCPRAGQIWASEHMVEAVEELADLGVTWVAIHPYAGVRRDGSIRYQEAAEGGYLDRAIEIIRQAGLKVFLKPHLAYWGSFNWRGEIQFEDDEAAWSRFFEGYSRFIVDQAAFAERHQIPLFAVGVELEATFVRPGPWQKILSQVRRTYGGHITYAANWSSLSDVSLWSELDSIGVHAYFPLAGAKERPTRQSLEAAWDRQLAELETLSNSLGKPILFAEIGYNRSASAAVEPWDYDVEDSAENRQLRQLLMEVATEKAEAADFLMGTFWWKWIPGNYSRRSNFSMRDDEAKEVLRRYWKADLPAQPSTKPSSGVSPQ